MVETLRFVPSLLRSMWTHLRARPFRPDYAAAANSLISARFKECGHVGWSLDHAGLEVLQRETREVLGPWAEQHRSIPPGSRSMWNALLNLSRDRHGGIFEGIETHLPQEIRAALDELLGGAVIQVVQLSNLFSDDHELFTFGDDHALRRHAPWHVDPIINTIKILIYLTDVSIDSGPFHYFTGSHRLNDSLFDRAVMHAHRYSWTGGAAWTWFNDPESRRRFGSLPGVFQKKNIIGAEFGDQWPFMERAEDAITTYTGPAGTGILFDPLGLHRGGLVQRGERQALIVSFRSRG